MMRILMLAVALAFAPAAAAQPEEGELWRVTTLRAAPGELRALIEDVNALKALGYFEAAGRQAPTVMRHSQGDHWDLMLVEPVDALAVHLEEDWSAIEGMADRIAFQEDLFARGPSRETVLPAFAEAGLYHIEMFHALHGREAELLEQRRMENVYLEATGQVTNFVFTGLFGSDVDVFTIGAHASLESFAAPPEGATEALNAAAVAAGFESRGDIGFYLRGLLARHQDTLATAVRP